jgi:hypothetical protein
LPLNILQPGERVVARATLHWVIYLGGRLAAPFAAVVVAIVGWRATHFGSVLLAVALLLAAVGLALTVRSRWRRWGTEIAVTNRRVIYKNGVIRQIRFPCHSGNLIPAYCPEDHACRASRTMNSRMEGEATGSIHRPAMVGTASKPITTTVENHSGDASGSVGSNGLAADLHGDDQLPPGKDIHDRHGAHRGASAIDVPMVPVEPPIRTGRPTASKINCARTP